MSPGDSAGPRVLLRRLRQVMAAGGPVQSRLDDVTHTIARDMATDVCSVYLTRAGEVLELFSTHGLNPHAVHATRLRLGEGIVGDIAAHARPLNLRDAPSHPQFAFRPETGEEPYHSLLGVPILWSRRVVGVLVVQNRAQRVYTEDEVEALQTIAMVLAELVGSGELVPASELQEADGNVTLPQRMEGTSLSDGLGRGIAVMHEPPVEVHQLIAEDPLHEVEHLDRALAELGESLDGMLAGTGASLDGEHRAILETYRMFSRDRGWLSRIREAIEGGLTADAAVQRVQLDNRARMASVPDAYLRERLHDLEDLSNRLLRHLSGQPNTAASKQLPDNAIVIARNMGPAELLDYDRGKLQAVLLEEGSPNAHVAIVARALGIPMVGRLAGVLDRILAGDSIVVDGRQGLAYLRPGEDVFQSYEENLLALRQRRVEYAAQRDLPAETTDGRRISLHMNAGLLLDLPRLEETGAEGIGLFRTELQFMVQPSFPGVHVQRDLYARVLDEAGDAPVLFRTLDIGGDKVLPYAEPGAEPEENPAMGWRALRVSLDRPALLRTQLRALFLAASGRKLQVMFPMVAEIAEFRAARHLLDLELSRLASRHIDPPQDLRVGVMLEVPSLIWQLRGILSLVDFVSIGSNDLLQFLYASDRSNPRLADRYDTLSPGFINLLRSIVLQCEEAGVSLSLCGEMAGRPLEAMALIGLGLRTLSLPPSAIGPVKLMIRSVNFGTLKGYIETMYDLSDHSLRDKLRNFARDHGFII